MADPITGIETEDRTQDVLDYLGRKSPLSFSGQTALPGVASSVPSSGPSGPSGAGATLGGPRSAAPGASSEAPSGVDSSALILNTVGQGIGGAKSATQTAKTLFGDSGTGGPSFPEGLTLGGTEAAGPQFPEGLSLGGAEAEGAQFPEGLTIGGGDAGGAGTPGLDLVGAGLSGASLAALVAQLAESGTITPRQAAGLLQSGGGTASNLAATLGPAPAGESGGALAGTLGAESAGLLGTAGTVLGGAGAVASIGLSVADAVKAIHAADDDPRQWSTAAGVGVGLGGGAVAGGLLAGPYGALIGAGVGGAAGDAIGQAIAKNLPPTHYMALRQHWGEVAQDALNEYGFGIEKAASNGGLPEIQQAMGKRYADGHVQAYLTLPESVAAALGVPMMTGFADLSPEQFVTLLKAASQTDPAEYARWVTGSGDVQYLEQGRAQQVADAAKGTATATLTAMIGQLRPLLDQMPSVAAESIESSRVWAAGAPQRETELRAEREAQYPFYAPESGGGDA